jgi:hypothetical protein
MDSQELYRGNYHSHPYGEINCVIPLNETAQLKGMSGWQGAGWTSPGAGTHHYPEVSVQVRIDRYFVLTHHNKVRGGAVVALYFLPAGRISFLATPDMPQPKVV